MNSQKGLQGAGEGPPTSLEGGSGTAHSYPLREIGWEPIWSSLFPAPQLGLSPKCTSSDTDGSGHEK